MRPRVFPAEDAGAPPLTAAESQSRFNEAAGIPRGRRGYGSKLTTPYMVLQ